MDDYLTSFWNNIIGLGTYRTDSETVFVAVEVRRFDFGQ